MDQSKPSTEDYIRILNWMLKYLEKGRFPMKQTPLWATYKNSILKTKSHCNIVAYWMKSGDNFGIPPELSKMLMNDPRFIRLEYSGRDVYYDSKHKTNLGEARD